MTHRTSEKPKNVLADLIIPTLALAFAVYYLTTIQEVPWIAQASAVLVSCLLFAAIIAFAVRTVARIRAGREFIGFSSIEFDTALLAKRLALLALTIGYVWFLEPLGFVVCTTAFVFLAILLLSSLSNWKNAALIALTCSVIGYVVFILVFETRFPKGAVEQFIEETLDGR